MTQQDSRAGLARISSGRLPETPFKMCGRRGTKTIGRSRYCRAPDEPRLALKERSPHLSNHGGAHASRRRADSLAAGG